MYDVVYNWLEHHPKWVTMLQFALKFTPIVFALIFLSLLASLFIKGEFEMLFKVVLVCGSTFILETGLRKLINAPRPYQEGRKGWIVKETMGKSFPSRHAVSATIIAVSCIYCHCYGGLMSLLALFMGTLRYIGGVHYAKDIFAGIAFAIICGMIGFWMI